MATPDQQAALHKEGSLELAIQAYQRGEFQSYTNAATAYDVTRSTIQRRISGTQSKLESATKRRLLTPTEEESLIQ